MTKTADSLKRYECGPLRFDDEDYYDRHLVFDHVVPLERASARDRFEAMARLGPRRARPALDRSPSGRTTIRTPRRFITFRWSS